MSQPRASVIVVSRGGSRQLDSCLAHLSSAVPFETIVALNSSDGKAAAELEGRHPTARVLHSSVELGLAGALNRARAQASGEFLVSLHDDVEVEPGWLEALVRAAEEIPDAGAVGSLTLNIDSSPQSAGCELRADGRTEALALASVDRPYEVDYAGSASLLIRSDSWDQIGGADERFHPVYYVDVDLCLAIRARGQRVLLEPRSTIRHHRAASTSQHRAAWLAERNRALLLEKWGTPPRPTTPAPRQLRESDPARHEPAQLRRTADMHAAYAQSLGQERENHLRHARWLEQQLLERTRAVARLEEHSQWLQAQLDERRRRTQRLEEHINWLEQQLEA